MTKLPPLPLRDLTPLDTREVWAALTEAHRHLAELKGGLGVRLVIVTAS